MAKKRIIPKLLVKKGGYNNSQNVVVRTNKFSNHIQTGEVKSQAKIFQDQIADEIIILFIDKSYSLKEKVIIIDQIADEIFMPITVGGGIKSIEEIKLLLSNGADKISINSNALVNKDLIRQASLSYGKSTIVISIDYKVNAKGIAKVFSNNGQKSTNIDLIEWVKEVESMGAGEINLTSILNDGCRKGLDLQIVKKIQDITNIPVVASGGCGLGSHFIDGFKYTGISGISAGTFFALQDQNFIQIRSQIKNSSINIRV